jgi:hypothetical protein
MGCRLSSVPDARDKAERQEAGVQIRLGDEWVRWHHKTSIGVRTLQIALPTSFRYRPEFRYWEAWEDVKKFTILAIVTMIENPMHGCLYVVLFMMFFTIRLTAARPFTSLLIYYGHIATDFVVVLVALVGIVAVTTPGDTLPTIFLVQLCRVLFWASFPAFAAILLLELASYGEDSKLRRVWNSFLISATDLASGAAATIRRSLTKERIAPIPPWMSRSEFVEVGSSIIIGGHLIHMPPGVQ